MNIKILIILMLSILISATLVNADIYCYVDSNGVSHFTNVAKSSKYKLYLRESKKKRKKKGRYDSLIKEASLKYDIEFSLVKALIKVESNFKRKAVSKVGAMGLMQIMPANMRLLKIKNPFNPRQNIMGGTLYLKKMIKTFPGNLSFAIAAYNAGPASVQKYKGIPPYKETQNFVKRVMRYYSYYKK